MFVAELNERNADKIILNLLAGNPLQLNRKWLFKNSRNHYEKNHMYNLKCSINELFVDSKIKNLFYND